MGIIVNSVASITKGTDIDVPPLNLNLNIVAVLQPLKMKEEDGLTLTQWS